MRRILKYVIAAMIAIVAVSCEVELLSFIEGKEDHPGEVPGSGEDVGEGEGGPGDGGNPTTPIKRRPIVPGGKLKRPRVIDNTAIFSCSANE